jgi:hypothetical protein
VTKSQDRTTLLIVLVVLLTLEGPILAPPRDEVNNEPRKREGWRVSGNRMAVVRIPSLSAVTRDRLSSTLIGPLTGHNRPIRRGIIVNKRRGITTWANRKTKNLFAERQVVIGVADTGYDISAHARGREKSSMWLDISEKLWYAVRQRRCAATT